MYKRHFEGEEVQSSKRCYVEPDFAYVKLISSDRKEFIVKKEHAMVSGTIRAMLSENKTNEIYLSDISSHVLGNVCEYFEYKAHKTTGSGDAIFQIDSEMLCDLFTAARYLDC